MAIKHSHCLLCFLLVLFLDRDDYDREGRNRYPDDDEDERFSTTYRERDRRYDNERDRERDHRDPRRYDDRDRAYNRQDYDDDRRSGYGPPDRDRARDSRRRDTRRFVLLFFILDDWLSIFLFRKISRGQFRTISPNHFLKYEPIA